MILVSGYSVELRTKIIDRWLELEAPKTQSNADIFRIAYENALKLEAMEKQALLDAPKTAIYDKLISSESLIDMRKAAAVMNIKGVGRNNLFSLLREKGILDENNVPYRSHQEQGRFEVKEYTFSTPEKKTRVGLQTYVTQKGIEFMLKLLQK
jgi:phage antirepressor YoqD-like protein